MGNDLNFEKLTRFSSFAVGAPGKRTFFLALGDEGRWVRVWLEKEHLAAFALGVEKMAASLDHEQVNSAKKVKPHPLAKGPPAGLPAAELDALEIVLDFESAEAKVSILANPSGAHEREPLWATGQMTLAQLKEVAKEAAAVCAAGRPLCQVCGNPMDPSGHRCPAKN